MVTNETVPHASQTAQALPPRALLGIPFHLADHYETIPPPIVTMPPPIVTVKPMDCISTASLPAKFRMPYIERYNGIGCPKIHLRLYNTIMRAHIIDDARANIDVSRRELEATRHRSDKFISSFVSRWRAKVDLKSLVHATFSVEEAITRGLWTYTVLSPNSKEKKLIGSSSKSREVDTISYQHQRPAHHSPYRPPTVRVHSSHPQYQYQSVYVQQPYIAQTSM
ncbi:hypothetical protein CK203_073386 [Vitis vinifera]|uniref:Uncharacterized protein n=1 Tax=Vitis vinifera TaxID=29760 RepID=A0A438ESA1_VITVI|nr:hypothetical protein CK203_073386 [Vitis vinifera]